MSIHAQQSRQAQQWVESLQDYLRGEQTPHPSFEPISESAQAVFVRPQILNAAVHSAIRPNAAVPVASTPIKEQAKIQIKEQFRAGTLNRPLIDAIDSRVLQRSPLAIQAKPQWTIANRQVYRQVPPVPTMDQPIRAGAFLLFPDPVWDYVNLPISDEIFIQRPQQEYLLIDRAQLQQVHLQDIDRVERRDRATGGASVNQMNQINAIAQINSGAIRPIAASTIYKAELVKALQSKRGKFRVRRAFFASTQPWMQDFKLIVRQESRGNQIKITGGTAYLTVGLYTQSKLDQLGDYRSVWTEALENAGYGTHLWKFMPVSLRNLSASLDLPPGCSADSSADAEAGTVTFVIQLSETIAQAWKQALESNQPDQLAGICFVRASYFARENDRLTRDQQTFSISLATLLRNCKPDVVQLLDPTFAIHTAIEVRGSSTVDSVTLNWRPSAGSSPIQQVFGADGGLLSGTVTATDLNQVAIDWSAQVKYKMAGWPLMTQTGKLSADLLREVVKPSSSDWVQQYTLFSAFMAAPGQIAVDLDQFDDIVVEATFSLTAAALTVPLTTSVELSNTGITQIPFPVLPDPASHRVGLVVTTKSQSSNRPLQTVERALRPGDNLINTKIFADGRVEIQVDTDPIGESSIEAEIFALLASLAR